MTSEQIGINVAIAETRGWTQIVQQTIPTTDGNEGIALRGIKPPLRGWLPVPDYCNDPEAVLRIVSALKEDGGDIDLFLSHLGKITGERLRDADRAPAKDRAAAWAEAFLLTVGKWKELRRAPSSESPMRGKHPESQHTQFETKAREID